MDNVTYNNDTNVANVKKFVFQRKIIYKRIFDILNRQNTSNKEHTMYKAYCKTFQFIMKLGNYLLPYRTPNLIEGDDALHRLTGIIKENNISHIFIVTGKHVSKMSYFDEMLKDFGENSIKYSVFTDLNANPTSENVETGVKAYFESKSEALLAFGGGGPMDAAKAIGARIVNPKKSVSDLQGLLKVHKKIPMLFAVPTTSGTGSETTVAAVITDSVTHHKASINDTKLIPSYAVLDPRLTTGLSPFTTATTGMDALCHAVEAYTNHTYCTSLENDLAKKAVKLINDNIEEACTDGQNITARAAMQKAAFYAGRAFTRGCVGYVHAIGHTLGGLYNVPHGHAMACLLPKVMNAYGSAVYKRLSELADVCAISGNSDKEKAENFIKRIEDLNKILNIPDITDVIKPEDKPQIIEWAMREANPLYPVPVIWKKEDFEKFLDQIK